MGCPDRGGHEAEQSKVSCSVGALGSLLVVIDDHSSILHGYGDTRSQIYWGHDIDLLWLGDVIGHVTSGSACLECSTIKPPVVDPMLSC